MTSFEQVQLSFFSQMDKIQQAATGDVVRDAQQFTTVAPQGDFTNALKNVVLSVDQQQKDASAAVTAVELGESDDLVGAMVESQKASVAFTALLQVRNKFATAFDDIMRMPI